MISKLINNITLISNLISDIDKSLVWKFSNISEKRDIHPIVFLRKKITCHQWETHIAKGISYCGSNFLSSCAFLVTRIVRGLKRSMAETEIPLDRFERMAPASTSAAHFEGIRLPWWPHAVLHWNKSCGCLLEGRPNWKKIGTPYPKMVTVSRSIRWNWGKKRGGPQNTLDAAKITYTYKKLFAKFYDRMIKRGRMIKCNTNFFEKRIVIVSQKEWSYDERNDYKNFYIVAENIQFFSGTNEREISRVYEGGGREESKNKKR